MPTYRVTQRVYAYREYLVRSRSWKDAKRKIEQAFSSEAEIDSAKLPAGVTIEQSDLDNPAGWYFGEVVFVDSSDGLVSYYEV